MKKIPAFICIFIILLKTFIYSPVKATSGGLTIPANEVEPFAGVGLTIMQIITSGGHIDLSDYDSIDDLLSDPQLNPELRSDILGDYLTNGSISNENKNLIQIAKSDAILNNYDIDSLMLRWGATEYNTFANYSAQWINKYIDTDQIIVSPDPEYLSYLDAINGSGFNWIKNKPNTNYWASYPPTLFTWIPQYHASGVTPSDRVLLSCEVADINIVGFNDQYSIQYNFTSKDAFNYITDGVVRNTSNRALVWQSGSDLSVYYPGMLPWTYTYTGTLQQCFNDLSQSIRNANIYVNGVLWSYVGDINLPTVDFPDAIGADGGLSKDLAYDVVLPDTTNNEAYFDLTALLDAIAEMINDDSVGADKTLEWEDVGDNIFVDVAGDTVTTNNYSIYYVLTLNPVAEGTKEFPNIPLPPEMSDAFKGTSILAELIDGTQQVLPEELIVTFWGIICVMFIIGLIKILHK